MAAAKKKASVSTERARDPWLDAMHILSACGPASDDAPSADEIYKAQEIAEWAVSVAIGLRNPGMWPETRLRLEGELRAVSRAMHQVPSGQREGIQTLKREVEILKSWLVNWRRYGDDHLQILAGGFVAQLTISFERRVEIPLAIGVVNAMANHPHRVSARARWTALRALAKSLKCWSSGSTESFRTTYARA